MRRPESVLTIRKTFWQASDFIYLARDEMPFDSNIESYSSSESDSSFLYKD